MFSFAYFQPLRKLRPHKKQGLQKMFFTIIFSQLSEFRNLQIKLFFKQYILAIAVVFISLK